MIYFWMYLALGFLWISFAMLSGSWSRWKSYHAAKKQPISLSLEAFTMVVNMLTWPICLIIYITNKYIRHQTWL